MIRWSHPGRDVDLPAPLHEHALTHTPVRADASTAMLRRLELPDGRSVVAKHVAPELDWMMRATHDAGRAAELWVSGVMDRCPPTIDPALVRIEDDGGDGWWLYMEEVAFPRRGTRFARTDVARLLDYLGSLHSTYRGEDVPGLCSLHDLLGLVAPRTIETVGENTAFLHAVRRGWEIFAELAPADVVEAVFRLLEDPAPLVRALEEQGTTLVHADVHFGNAVLLDDRLVLLDWTLACAAPASVELVWFLDQSFGLLDATHDEVVAEFLRAEQGHVASEMLELASLAELLNAGWQCVHWIDDRDRAPHEANLDWFVTRARRAI